MSRYMPEGWNLPEIDALNEQFFTSGKLLIQQCTDCGTLQHLPEDVCHNCQAMTFDWVEASGKGTIYSYVIVHHPVHDMLRERVPYGVILVQLDDYPSIRIVGNLVDCPASDIEIGKPVSISFESVEGADGETVTIPQWVAA